MFEVRVSKIIRAGLSMGILLMTLGFIFTVFGRYSEELRFSYENIVTGRLLTDGAGLMYLGTFFILATPFTMLLYLMINFIFTSKKYSLYCLLMFIALGTVVFLRV